MGSVDQVGLATINSLGRNIARDADEKTALKAFDAYFLGEMLRRSAPQNPTGLFDGGDAGRMYQDHFYQELARIIAENGGFGLSESLEGQLGIQGDGDPKSEAVDDTAKREKESQ